MSAPACAGPTLGANCHGVNTGRCPSHRTCSEAFVARWYRGESRHRNGTRRFTQVSDPLCSRGKDLLLLLIIEGFWLVESTSRLADYMGCRLVTCVSMRSRLRVVRWWFVC